MAIACFGFVTFLPLRPDFSVPFFISRISVSAFLPDDGEYLRPDDFFALDFLALDFFAVELRVLLFAVLPRELRLSVLLLDFLLAAFFVAMTILLGGQMASGLGQVVCDGFAVGEAFGENVALHNAARPGHANKRIGDEPRGDARERAADSEFQKSRCDQRIKQVADAHQHQHSTSGSSPP